MSMIEGGRHHRSWIRRSSGAPTAAQRSFTSTSRALAAKKDPYAALGVTKSADKAEIKKAYYALAKKYHPDTNKDSGAKERFVEIQDAFDTLGDESKRSAYDRFGAAAQDPNFDAEAYQRASSSFGGAGAGPGGFGPGGFGAGAGSFNDFFANQGRAGGGASSQQAQDIFEQLFGGFGGASGGAGRAQRSRGEDIEVQLAVTFDEACKGTAKTIPISPVVTHAECKGSGIKPGAKRQTCKACNGTGAATFMVQGGFQMSTTCTTCRGQGSVIPPNGVCAGCQGVGVVKERTFVPIEVPPGIEDGMRIRMDGRGDAPFEGKGRSGDLYIRIAVGQSPTFRRQGANLFHDKTVPFHTAALGATVSIPTLDETVAVRVPSGTQQGEEMVLRGRGVRKLNSTQRGDLTVKFNVAVPRSLSSLQRSLLEQYRDAVDGKTAAKPAARAASSSATASTEPPPSSSMPPPKPAPAEEPRTAAKTTQDRQSKPIELERDPAQQPGLVGSFWRGIKGLFG